ncbi:MAG: glutamate--tRNA ligase [Candidatus Babeliales bacterium]
MTKNIRVRFAPSPTGLMHLGSVRTALFNYLFAKQKDGTFILRIEDTDPERNFDPGAKKIIHDMAWLNLAFEEGPEVGGPYQSYFQSERTALYQERLDILEQQQRIYRCFCSAEELEKKRKRQIALKQPPRYDRACLQLSQKTIEDFLAEKKPFIWRFKVDNSQKISIQDIARGSIEFDMHHFSDFPLTRSTGSFTFMFANAIDDMVMKISHVFRGEDHISNTPCQAALYEAFNMPLPIFWHMPIMCNIEGKKLSKRDFGFSLQDLREAGFLPEAINNYLAIIGSSYEQEIMDMPTLIKTIDFSAIHSTSSIKYDVEKLKWVNHQWLMHYPAEKLAQRTIPILINAYPEAKNLTLDQIATLIKAVQPELKTLNDIPGLLRFYFKAPSVEHKELLAYASESEVKAIVNLFENNLDKTDDANLFFDSIKNDCKQKNIPLKATWQIFRVIMTGSPSGPGIKELLVLLGAQETQNRFKALKK